MALSKQETISLDEVKSSKKNIKQLKRQVEQFEETFDAAGSSDSVAPRCSRLAAFCNSAKSNFEQFRNKVLNSPAYQAAKEKADDAKIRVVNFAQDVYVGYKAARMAMDQQEQNRCTDRAYAMFDKLIVDDAAAAKFRKDYESSSLMPIFEKWEEQHKNMTLDRANEVDLSLDKDVIKSTSPESTVKAAAEVTIEPTNRIEPNDTVDKSEATVVDPIDARSRIQVRTGGKSIAVESVDKTADAVSAKNDENVTGHVSEGASENAPDSMQSMRDRLQTNSSSGFNMYLDDMRRLLNTMQMTMDMYNNPEFKDNAEAQKLIHASLIEQSQTLLDGSRAIHNRLKAGAGFPSDTVADRTAAVDMTAPRVSAKNVVADVEVDTL